MDIDIQCVNGVKKWINTKQCATLSEHYISIEEKEKNEVDIRAMLEKIQPFMEKFPNQKMAQKLWRKKGQDFLKDYMSKDGMFLMKEMSLKDSEAFYDITTRFIKDARTFDEHLSLEDIGQAMRNIWILVILQRIFKQDIMYHKAMFAYSMLYPYSDNYIDDPTIEKKYKQQFNAWFTKRLKALPVEIHNEHEQHISDLIAMIEDQFPRAIFPQVYDSLLMIQAAQIVSLDQQDGETCLSTEELTYISYRKGGASVVADGYLISGSLSEEQVTFCMEYGFMLQIGDDLQDAKGDQEHHHQTLASTKISSGLDGILMKLIQYTKDILRPRAICMDEDLLSFVCNNCLMLLYLAVSKHNEYYQKEVVEEVLQCMPVSKKFMEEMEELMRLDMTQEELMERVDCLIEDTNIDKN